MEADKIFKANKIITAPGGAEAAFVAVRDGRVIAVGPEDDARDFERAGVPVVDLGNAVMLPGLWDAHVHLLMTGLALRHVDLRGTRCLDDVLALVREAAGGADVTLCVGLDEGRLAERRLPTGAELDAVAPRAPVAVARIDLHSLILNSAAWESLAVDASWPGVELDATGEPTGVLRGRAHELVRGRMRQRLDDDARATAYRDAAALAASRGVVALGALEGGPRSGPADVRALQRCRDALPVETFIFPQVPSAATARELGLPRLGGCILVDGSFGSWTAALFEPYADRPTTRGELYFAADDLNALVLGAHAAGLQVALHAIGDRAVGQVLDAYEIAAQEHPRADCRHRVEHAELLSDFDLRRAAELGVTFSMQPAFEWFWGGEGGMYEERLGERYRRTNRFRSALRAGVALAGGSDSNITPLDPLLGIAAAVNHPTEEERLAFDEALAMFTTGAAAAFFAEDDYGTIAPGKYASFTVLARDPRGLAAAEMAATEVTATVVKGEFKYRKEEGEAL